MTNSPPDSIDIDFEEMEDALDKPEREFVGEWRWGNVWRVVFLWNGAHYAFNQRTSSGDAECDDEPPSKAYRVVQRDVVVKRWVRP